MSPMMPYGSSGGKGGSMGGGMGPRHWPRLATQEAAVMGGSTPSPVARACRASSSTHASGPSRAGLTTP